MIYEEVFKALNRRRVKYAVAGGVAVVIHGYVRVTVDLDIIIDGSSDNIKKLFAVLDHLGYRPRIPVTAEEFKDPKKRAEWREKKHMKAFPFFHRKNPLKMIDILIHKMNHFSKMKRVVFNMDGIKVPTVSLEDLKHMKMEAGRPKDELDLEFINELLKMRRKKR